MRKCTLNAVAPGTLISYRERHAIVLEHLPQGVFVQLVDPIEDHAFGKTNVWRESDLRQYLNGEFARLLCEGNTDELLDTVTDLTAMDGTTDYGSSVDKVTLLTIDQCRKYRYTRPLPDEWEWTSTPASTPGGWDEDRTGADDPQRQIRHLHKLEPADLRQKVTQAGSASHFPQTPLRRLAHIRVDKQHALAEHGVADGDVRRREALAL